MKRQATQLGALDGDDVAASEGACVEVAAGRASEHWIVVVDDERALREARQSARDLWDHRDPSDLPALWVYELSKAVVRAEPNGVTNEVDVVPAQRDEFATAQAGHRGGEVNRSILLAGRCANERVDLFTGVEIVVARAADRLWLDRPRWVLVILVSGTPRRRILVALTRSRGGEMGRVIVMNGVTLDGVMQGPGRPDEDTRDGFDHGGWGIPYGDEATVAKMGERMGSDRAWLFGRRTYEELLGYWNARGGPFKDALNDGRKYVASSNPATRLDWPNSTLLHGDVLAAVADLEQSSSGNLAIMGSGVLIGSLRAADLVDEYLLMIAPVVLGTGQRLFARGRPAALRLIESTVTSKGVVIASYRPAAD